MPSGHIHNTEISDQIELFSVNRWCSCIHVGTRSVVNSTGRWRGDANNKQDNCALLERCNYSMSRRIRYVVYAE